jgi:hypothetical protein
LTNEIGGTNEWRVFCRRGERSVMLRDRLVITVLGAIVAVASSGRPSWAQQTGAKPELLISLSVAPSPAPQPALEYLLIPELREMNPGNPIQGYFKCYLEQYRFVFDEENFDRRQILLAMPLEELPAPDAPELGRSALAQVDAAARLDSPDWQILLKLRADGFGTLLPDIQAMRILARALAGRYRVEVASGRIDDAIRTNKTMFAMAHQYGVHPTLVGNLVGIAIASIAINPLEELIQQSDCPNFYWALTSLPDPLVPIKRGMEGERLTLWGFTRDLDSTNPMSDDQIKRFIAHVEKNSGNDAALKANGGVRGYLDARTKDVAKLAAARKRLVDLGLPEAGVKAFPADQVILLDEECELRARFDDIAKIMGFPAWQFQALYEKLSSGKKEPALLADLFLPSQVGVRWAAARLEQRIALLRNVEALRMHAAEHKGAFPARLADVSVPLPDDPVTGKPFVYELIGKTAHLRGTAPKGMEQNRFFHVHYEMTSKD